jgi:hypothetical protein
MTGGGGAAGIELALPAESTEGGPGDQSRSTTRGTPWCLVPVIARRAGMAAGVSTKTQVYRVVSGP